jgi:hypothetical protein
MDPGPEDWLEVPVTEMIFDLRAGALDKWTLGFRKVRSHYWHIRIWEEKAVWRA